MNYLFLRIYDTLKKRWAEDPERFISFLGQPVPIESGGCAYKSTLQVSMCVGCRDDAGRMIWSGDLVTFLLRRPVGKTDKQRRANEQLGVQEMERRIGVVEYAPKRGQFVVRSGLLALNVPDCEAISVMGNVIPYPSIARFAKSGKMADGVIAEILLETSGEPA